MQTDIQLEAIVLAKLVFALILGAVIGLDRERHGKEMGIRTYAAVTIGATLFTCVTAHMQNDVSAVSRVVANIITGVGFLGIGVIYKDGAGNSHGLTTAATVWATAAIGVAIGLNMFFIALGATGLLYFLISLHHRPWYIRWKNKICGREN